MFFVVRMSDAAGTGRSTGSGVKLEAQGLHDLQNRCQLGIAVAGEGLVQALSSTAFLAFSKAVEGCLTGQIFIVE